MYQPVKQSKRDSLRADAPSQDRSARRPIGAGAITTTLVVIALVVGASWLSGHTAGDAKNRGAIESGTAAVPAEQMPHHLEATARQVLGEHVTLGDARTVALDAENGPVPIGDVQKAAALYVAFGDPSVHNWKVFLGRSDGKPGQECPNVSGVASCETKSVADGSVLVTTTIVLRSAPDLGDGMYTFADISALTKEDLPDLRVERNVRAFHADGTMTSATEQVNGPGSLDFGSAFESPVADLTVLATDRSLVAP